MKTKSFLPVILIGLAFGLVSCSAANTAVSTPTPIAPVPSNTPMPVVTVTPTPIPPPDSTQAVPPAPTNTPAPGRTGTVDVTMMNYAFDPPSVTVKVGTTVRWTNQDNAGLSVTSNTGVWDSGNITQGSTYSRVFDTLGTFAYHCGIHPSMKGTILVTS